MAEITYTGGVAEDSPHYGHLLDYNERALVSRKIDRIDFVNGVAVVRPEDVPPEVESISESFLYCITCGVQISGDEIGAEDWEVG